MAMYMYSLSLMTELRIIEKKGEQTRENAITCPQSHPIYKMLNIRIGWD